MVNRAEELITQLEAEIVKRDARIAELEAITPCKCPGLYCVKASELEHQRGGVVLPEPVSAFSLDDAVEGEHREYGSGWFFTDNCQGEYFRADDVRTLVARLNPCRAQAVPDGLVMVPVQMTDAMRDAGNVHTLNRATLCRIWADMLASAPSAKKESGDE